MGQLKLILPAEKAANHHDKGKARGHSLTAAELAVVQRFAPPTAARRDLPRVEPQEMASIGQPPVSERPPEQPAPSAPASPPPACAPVPAPLPQFTLTPGMRM